MNSQRVMGYLRENPGGIARQVSTSTGISLDVCRTELMRLKRAGKVIISGQVKVNGGLANCYSINYATPWHKFCFKGKPE